MKLLLSDISALWHIRRARCLRTPLEPRPLPDPRECATGPRMLDRMGLGHMASARSPLFMMVPHTAPRAESRRVRQQKVNFSTLEPDNAWLVTTEDRDVFAVAPGPCLLMLARRWDVPRIALAALELAGGFSLTPDESAFVQAEPVATIDSLWEAACKMDGHRGIGRLRSALRLAGERTESPFEAQVRLWLAAPTQFGGFGCGNPEANVAIELGSGYGWGRGPRTCRLDLYWPAAGFGVECDGKQHREKNQSDRDALRGIRLAKQNIHQVRIATEAFHSYNAACELGGAVRHELGLAPIEEDADFRENSMRLWKSLVSSPWDRKPMDARSGQ